MTTAPFTAALLAGGKSSRMGRDKATLAWEGQALWQRQIQLLESLKPSQLLISGRPDGPYLGSPYKIVFDPENNLGPLAGLKSLLEVCGSSRLLVLAVDMPWMSHAVLEKLLAFNEGVVPEHKGWREGTAAVYPVEILPLVREALQSSDRSLQGLSRLALEKGLLRIWQIPSEFEPCFESWNTLNQI